MSNSIRRTGSVAAATVSILVLGAVGALAQDSPVDQVLSEATSVVTTNVPIIALALAGILGIALGITALWTAYGNAKKGVKQMKG